MKVILNDALKGIDGAILTTATGNIISGADGVKTREVVNVDFSYIGYKAIINQHTQTDAQCEMMYTLAEECHVQSIAKDGREVTITDEEFSVLNQIMQRQTLIIKYRWIEMVKKLNPGVTTEQLGIDPATASAE